MLVWHHYQEFNLLHSINRDQINDRYQIGTWEAISQTLAYQKKKLRKARFSTLRMLSKLNKNIEFLPDAVILSNRKGDIYWCNTAAQEMFSFFWNKKAKKNLLNIIFYAEFKQFFEQPTKDKPLILMPNSHQYIEINMSEYDENYYLLIARDITQIIQLLHSRQTFLSNLNHELRTPLTVLQGYLELLSENQQSSELHQKAITAMQQQTQRMQHLLEQLTLLIKIETASHSERNEVINIPQIILSLQNDSQILTNQNIELSFDVESDLKIKANQVEITSTITNLVYNALRHAEASKIHIVWKTAPCGGAYFSVKDNGKGISAKHIPNLTERFYQISQSRKRVNGTENGSGIGLAIVKHSLAHLNSHLEIQSDLGKGSQFSFTIPTQFVVRNILT